MKTEESQQLSVGPWYLESGYVTREIREGDGKGKDKYLAIIHNTDLVTKYD